jgi:LEA14-like dessication related protein
LKIKVDFIFCNGNFIAKIMVFNKSFQHENVFGRHLKKTPYETWNIYLNLTFEVKFMRLKVNFKPKQFV